MIFTCEHCQKEVENNDRFPDICTWSYYYNPEIYLKLCPDCLKEVRAIEEKIDELLEELNTFYGTASIGKRELRAIAGVEIIN